MCRKKKLLYNKARKSSNPALWEKYRKLNNVVKRECNLARWTYINNMASDIAVSGNSKPFWNYIKSKRNGTNTLVSLKVGDKELIENDSIASSFNSYFSSVFTSEDFTNLPSLEPLVCEKLNYISCTTEEILKHLKSLKTNKSPGPDRSEERRVGKECRSRWSPYH